MKKVISLILSIVMIASLFAGCGASQTAENTVATATSTPAASEAVEAETQEFTVAIVQQLDHSSLDEIRTAIKAQLEALSAEKNITITIEADDAVKAAVAKHADYIQKETLAVAIAEAEVAEKFDLNGHKTGIAVERV